MELREIPASLLLPRQFPVAEVGKLSGVVWSKQRNLQQDHLDTTSGFPMIPGSAQDQVGWGLDQPGLVGGVLGTQK